MDEKGFVKYINPEDDDGGGGDRVVPRYMNAASSHIQASRRADELRGTDTVL